MLKVRTYRTEAIVIRKTKLGEADRILTMYTPDFGKVRAVAKGVRKPKSKMSGHLELLTHIDITFVKGRNLDTVINCQTINSFLPMKGSLEKAAAGLYISELVDQFTADDDHNLSVFVLLRDTLSFLSAGTNPEAALRNFELRLLDIVGYRPQFNECVNCHAVLESETQWFSAGSGGILCPDCAHNQYITFKLSLQAIKAFRFLQENDLNIAGRLKLDGSLAMELQEAMRRYIKFLIERDIKSNAWLDTVKACHR